MDYPHSIGEIMEGWYDNLIDSSPKISLHELKSCQSDYARCIRYLFIYRNMVYRKVIANNKLGGYSV